MGFTGLTIKGMQAYPFTLQWCQFQELRSSSEKSKQTDSCAIETITILNRLLHNNNYYVLCYALFYFVLDSVTCLII